MPVVRAAVTVFLSEDDYVCSYAGSRRADYDKDVADATRCPCSEMTFALTNLSMERGVDRRNTHQMLVLTREIMRARYDAELRRRMRAQA